MYTKDEPVLTLHQIAVNAADERDDINRDAAEAVLRSAIRQTLVQIANGGRVRLPKFGTFSRHTCRIADNLQRPDGRPVFNTGSASGEIRYKLHFKPSELTRSIINGYERPPRKTPAGAVEAATGDTLTDDTASNDGEKETV